MVHVPLGQMDCSAWFDEVDLEPDANWLHMGTRSLGHNPWLVADNARRSELDLKDELLATRFEDVFVASDESAVPGEELLDLVRGAVDQSGVEIEASSDKPRASGRHPLDDAGRMVQEDLCLLQRRPGSSGVAWYLDAASLCFPSRWRLTDKIGRPITDVHGPVSGYATELADRVNGLFDALADRDRSRPVRRRNWFVHPDSSLYQPDRPPQGDPTIPAPDVLDGLWLRSERQTLRALPSSGWIVFTIRVQQASLAEFLEDQSRRSQFITYLNRAPAASWSHRGLSVEQQRELLLALS